MSIFLSAFIYYVFVIPISHLPFWVLYLISDFLYYFMYYIARYRRKVVRENLQNSFPNSKEEELIEIEKKFYRHFADFLIESVKSLSISDKEIRKRCAIINPELVDEYFEQGKDVIVLCGHYNNWEYYAVGIAQQMKHKVIAAYHPLKNQFFNRKILELRQRFGIQMVSMRKVPRFFAELKENHKPVLSVMLNDQSPSDPKNAYWNTFLHQETGWMQGAEKLAKKYNQVILFGAIHKKKRGFYEVHFSHICEDFSDKEDGFALDRHAAYLEEIIMKEPQYWLWSHRRWKHKGPTEN